MVLLPLSWGCSFYRVMSVHIRPSASVSTHPVFLDTLLWMSPSGQYCFLSSDLHLCFTGCLGSVWFFKAFCIMKLWYCSWVQSHCVSTAQQPNALLPPFTFTFVALSETSKPRNGCNCTHWHDCYRPWCINQVWDYDPWWNVLAVWKSWIGFSRLGLYQCKQVDDNTKLKTKAESSRKHHWFCSVCILCFPVHLLLLHWPCSLWRLWSCTNQSQGTLAHPKQITKVPL